MVKYFEKSVNWNTIYTELFISIQFLNPWSFFINHFGGIMKCRYNAQEITEIVHVTMKKTYYYRFFFTVKYYRRSLAFQRITTNSSATNSLNAIQMQRKKKTFASSLCRKFDEIVWRDTAQPTDWLNLNLMFWELHHLVLSGKNGLIYCTAYINPKCLI